MKTTVTLAAAVLAAGALVPVVAAHGRSHGTRTVPPQVLEKFDANKDGKLDDTERSAAKAEFKAQRQALVEKYDADKDGKLSREERQAIPESERPPMMRGGRGGRGHDRGFDRERVLEKYDTDKDGKLSDTEREAARSEWKSKGKDKF